MELRFWLLPLGARSWIDGEPVYVYQNLAEAQVRRLEAQGIPSKQAEAITSAITEVLNDSLENVAHSFVSQGELQKVNYPPFPT